MNFRALKAFLTVCEYGNITKAAEVLYITQPALSRQIQEMEKEYNCKLLIRGKRKIELTESGNLLQLRAAELLAMHERLKKELDQTNGSLTGIVRIGCVESNVAIILNNLLTQWCAQSKSLKFEVYSGDGNDIRNMLDENKLDLGICLEPIEVAKYESFGFHTQERWGAVVNASSELGKYEKIDRSNIADIPLILPRRPIVIDNLISWFGIESHSLQIVGYHNIPTNMLPMVKNSPVALLCVEGSYSIRPVEGLRFIPLDPVRYVRHCLIRKKKQVLSKAAEMLWDYAKTHFKEIEREALKS